MGLGSGLWVRVKVRIECNYVYRGVNIHYTLGLVK